MHIDTQKQPSHARARQNFKAETKPESKTSNREWKPEPCGLTRKELREIVANMLG
jgi:hypothetical protein